MKNCNHPTISDCKAVLRANESCDCRWCCFNQEFRKVKLPSDTSKCPVCGEHPTITELIDYEQEVCEETAGRFETKENQ